MGDADAIGIGILPIFGYRGVEAGISGVNCAVIIEIQVLVCAPVGPLVDQLDGGPVECISGGKVERCGDGNRDVDSRLQIAALDRRSAGCRRLRGAGCDAPSFFVGRLRAVPQDVATRGG